MSSTSPCLIADAVSYVHAMVKGRCLVGSELVGARDKETWRATTGALWARTNRTMVHERDVPGGMCYVERICEGVAWGACDRVRSLCKVWKGGLEVLQQLFIRLCL
jgi:hypothetical protein